MLHHEPARPARQAARGGDQQLREHPAQHAAGQRAQRDGDPARAEIELRRDHPEIRVVPGEGDGGDAGQDHGGEHRAGGSRLEGVAQFLDGEDDAGNRRVERRRHARRPAGQHQRPLHLDARQLQQLAERVHHRRPDLHRRPLAPDRGAGGKPQQGQADLADCHAHGQHPVDGAGVVHVQGGDGLGNAAALGAGEHPARQHHGDRQPGRNDQQRQRRVAMQRGGKQPLRHIGRAGEQDGDRRDDDCTAPIYQPPLPLPRREQRQAGDAAQPRGAARSAARCGLSHSSMHSCYDPWR